MHNIKCVFFLFFNLFLTLCKGSFIRKFTYIYNKQRCLNFSIMKICIINDLAGLTIKIVNKNLMKLAQKFFSS